MDKTVSAAAANRNFWRILKAVTAGETYLVTSRLLSRLRAQPVRVIGRRWSRGALYDG